MFVFLQSDVNILNLLLNWLEFHGQKPKMKTTMMKAKR